MARYFGIAHDTILKNSPNKNLINKMTDELPYLRTTNLNSLVN